MKSNIKDAVVLLSGGLDSVASLAFVKKYSNRILALTFNYGQKSFMREYIASKRIADYYDAVHEVVDITWLGKISSSSLNTNEDIPMLSQDLLENFDMVKKTAAAVNVPNRNALFVNIAACYAEAQNYDTIIIGANKEEAATFKDNSKEFINAVNSSLKSSLNSDVMLYAPFLESTKKDIAEFCIKENVPLDLIYSCYNSSEKHCGKCESCVRLLRALKLNGAYDIIKNIFGDIL